MAFQKDLHRFGFAVSGIVGCFLMISILPSLVFEYPGGTYQKVIGSGSAANLKRACKRWAAEYAFFSPSGPAVTRVWNEKFSSDYKRTGNVAHISLEEKLVQVRIKGCDGHRISGVRLVHITPPPDKGTLPEWDDRMIRKETLRGASRLCGACDSGEDNLTAEPKLLATLPTQTDR
jgi:hypothetical protein